VCARLPTNLLCVHSPKTLLPPFGESLPHDPHVPSSWFCATSTVYSARQGSGLLHPDARTGSLRFGSQPPSTCFVPSRSQSQCTRKGSALLPATRFTPFEEFPSPIAAPHHCGRSPHVVAVAVPTVSSPVAEATKPIRSAPRSDRTPRRASRPSRFRPKPKPKSQTLAASLDRSLSHRALRRSDGQGLHHRAGRVSRRSSDPADSPDAPAEADTPDVKCISRKHSGTEAPKHQQKPHSVNRHYKWS